MTRFQLLPLLSGCRPEESSLVGRLWLLAFCFGFSSSLFRNAAQSLFLGSRDLDDLLLAWLGSAVLSWLILAVFGRLQARVSRVATCTGLLGAFLLTITAIRLTLLAGWSRDTGILLGGYVAEVTYLLGALGYWPVATSLLDLRQGKRVFGFLATGEALAEILGGFAIPLVVNTIGVPALLDGAVLALTAALLLARNTLQRHATDSGPSKPRERSTSVLASLKSNSYLRLILTCYGLAIVCSYLLDYLFRAGVKAQSSSDSGEIATWLGLFSAAVNGLSLITQAMIAPRLLERVGIRRVLPVLPVVATLGVAVALMLTFAGVGKGLFVAIICTRLGERVLTRGLQAPTIRVLYQAVPDSQRVGFQTLVEVTGNVALAAVSVTLLLLRESLGEGGKAVLLPLTPVLLCWAWSSVALGRVYLAHIQERLARRQISVAGIAADASARDVLANWLQREEPSEVLHALRLVRKLPADSVFTDIIGKLLPHPNALIRREAILRLAASGEVRWAEPIYRLMETDPDAQVRAVAVLGLAALAPHEALEPLLTLADGTDEPLAHAALVGLLRDGGLEGVLAAGPRLMALVGSHEPAQRASAATVLGAVGLPAFHRPLLALLRDPDVTVRRAALEAAGEVRHVALWPAVCEQLTRRDLRLAAVRTLQRAGSSALPAIAAAADREPNSAGRLLLVRQAWKLGGCEAAPVLLRWANSPDLRVRVEALDALLRLGYRLSPAEIPAQWRQVEADLEHATELAGCAAVLDDPTGLLGRALQLEWRWRVEAVLARLDFLEPTSGLRDVRRRLRGGGRERGLALEALEMILPRELGWALLMLLDEVPDKERLERLSVWVTSEEGGEAARLRLLWEEGAASSWTRACLLYEAGRSSRTDLRDVVERGVGDVNALVREAAEWALAQLEGRKR